MQPQLPDLIERAAATVGTQTELATMLGVTKQRLSERKAGRVPCPLHRQAQIAELAGVDAKEWVWGAICRQLGRAVATVALTLAASIAALHAPVADGARAPEPA